ncbi:MAG: hypothetical protein CMH52_09855 [Myxococcales bacterium]|nr:hypothetical protein [Myxococcales bacterium]
MPTCSILSSCEGGPVNERRQEPRKAAGGRVYLTHRGRCRVENLVNLSATGVCLQSDVRISPGEAVKIFLPMQQGSDWRMHMLLGTVVRRRSKSLRSSELAVELSETPNTQLASYRQFILSEFG